MVLATIGAVATWNKNLGPRWYPVALVVGALPTAWVGARLLLMGATRVELKDPAN